MDSDNCLTYWLTVTTRRFGPQDMNTYQLTFISQSLILGINRTARFELYRTWLFKAALLRVGETMTISLTIFSHLWKVSTVLWRARIENSSPSSPDDPTVWGYLPLLSTPGASYEPDHSLRSPPFRLFLLGSGWLEIPVELKNIVTMHVDLNYTGKERFGIMIICRAYSYGRFLCSHERNGCLLACVRRQRILSAPSKLNIRHGCGM